MKKEYELRGVFMPFLDSAIQNAALLSHNLHNHSSTFSGTQAQFHIETFL